MQINFGTVAIEEALLAMHSAPWVLLAYEAIALSDIIQRVEEFVKFSQNCISLLIVICTMCSYPVCFFLFVAV